MKSHIRDKSDRSSAPQQFRHVLQAELARRCAKNSHYSLRAFAKYLGVDHSTLSQMLRGKRRLTTRAIRKFSARLGLDNEAAEGFIALEEHGNGQTEDDVVIHQVRQLARDAASLIADWHHFAILELIRVRDFRPDSRWLARVLGISVDEVNVALQRLMSLGLLEMAAPDRWIDHLGDATASVQEFAHAAVERLSEQVRQLTLRALRSHSPGQFEHNSTTVAVRAARVPAAIEMISRLRREILAFVAQGGDCDDVYQLEISFIPVTRLQSKEKSDGTTGDALADRDQESGTAH
jgi:uncharacterized protein (TIGR02147 family)